ncbi:hypothetical protein SASPL_156200 [Salvia splendens]|uniref:Transmembrane protein n=1 Tax=Salvia splendens TaxID=180675 RepID=A0A8X8YXG6_SALSN|nr:uncharacterized protein LOC121789755 [Salvia splendens]KAG6383998.1 hypothetical protein SASPL_156200 [Salvia splendens]
MAPLLALALILFLSLSTNAEDRAHGLSSEPPVAISPEAFAFFHPDADAKQHPSGTNTCDSSHCTKLPLAATVKSAPAHESQSQSPTSGEHGLGAGGIAGISLSFLFVALVGMGVYHVMNKRKANIDRAKPEQLGEV